MTCSSATWGSHDMQFCHVGQLWHAVLPRGAAMTCSFATWGSHEMQFCHMEQPWWHSSHVGPAMMIQRPCGKAMIQKWPCGYRVVETISKWRIFYSSKPPARWISSWLFFVCFLVLYEYNWCGVLYYSGERKNFFFPPLEKVGQIRLLRREKTSQSLLTK